MDTRLRVGRAIGKNEEEVSLELMSQIKTRGHLDMPPAMASDGNDGYPEAMLATWGKVPDYSGRGRPPTRKISDIRWKFIQVVKHRSGSRLTGVTYRVVFGDSKEVRSLMGTHTAYVERTHLTSRQMNGRLVRKTLSFSKDVVMLNAACAWEDAVYNLARPLKSLRIEVNEVDRRWLQRSLAVAAGLTDHIWKIEEMLMRVIAPKSST
jgi:hypothetical protein